MQSKQTYLSTLLITFLSLFFSCGEDTPEPVAGDILIINEGNFGQANGSLSLYSREAEQVENNVFSEANSGRELEASVQSVRVHDEVAFIVCNAADKIEIVDAATLEALRAPLEDEGLISPRYLTVAGNKAYVTVWGPFDENFALTESKVAVIDLNDYSISKYIDVAAGPEGILAEGDKVFVANSFTNVLTVIDTNTDEVTEEITLEGSPQLMDTYATFLWVSVTGAASQFVQIDPIRNSITKTISVAGSNSNGKFTINKNLNSLYFIGAEPFPSSVTNILSLPLDASSPTYETLISGNSFYGIGSDPLSNELFVGNSNSFQGEGTLLRYDAQGMLLDSYAVGVGPNGFVF
jgi:YVTN family beta-propeller protein